MHNNSADQARNMNQAVASQMPSSAELASLYASLAEHENQAPQATAVGGAPGFGESQDKAWQQQQRLAPIGEPVSWESPRGSLDLGDELGDGGVRGGDTRLSSMPAYTLDYAGNIRAASQQLHADSLAGGTSRATRHSVDVCRRPSALARLSEQESARRVSADEGQRPNFNMGAGMRNAAYHQVYHQAYEHSQQQQQQEASQVYKRSSLYAPSSLGFPQQSGAAGGIHQEKTTTSPKFNPDAFGESLMFNGAHLNGSSGSASGPFSGPEDTQYSMHTQSNPANQRMGPPAGSEAFTSSAAFPHQDYASAEVQSDSYYCQSSLPMMHQTATLFPPSTQAQQGPAAGGAQWHY